MRAFVPALFLLLTAVTVHAGIIGHQEALAAESLSPDLSAEIAAQRWLFSHASVGADMIGGMDALHAADPDRFPLTATSAGSGSAILPPPARTEAGTIYEAHRGNPGWAAKFQLFEAAVREGGWHQPAVDVAMDKLCYIDPTADVSVYLTMMEGLERDFPQTRFIYVTLPLRAGSGANASNMLATTYNEAVRAHCADSDRILLDVADIECHDPTGERNVFTVGEQQYERLCWEYTHDGGHLNAEGARRVALGWYAAAAALAAAATATEPSDPATPAMPRTPVLHAAAPNPFNPATVLRFEIPVGGPVRLAVHDARGRLVATLQDGHLAAGAGEMVWRGLDDAGRALPSGVYLARLTTGDQVAVRRVALVR